MPNPKRKHSKGRRDRRRSQDTLTTISLVQCDNCGELRPSHTVCPNCGRTLDCTDLAVLQANACVNEDLEIVPCPGSDVRDFVPKAPSPGDEPAAPAAPGPEGTVANPP